jgi:HEAT repeat protein
MVFMCTVALAEAQGDLSELFSIIRTEGTALSESSRKRTFEILTPYSTGGKSFAGEWPAINDALGDPRPFVRDQACAVLSTLMLLNAAKPIELPDGTRQLVLQRFSEESPNLRENAVRIITLMAGGVPPALEPRLLQLARVDSAPSVRRMAIEALASMRIPTPEITDFWVQSLGRQQDRELRGAVLSAFRFHAQTDPQIIKLVMGALSDSDRFVRQEAIAAVTQIGKSAVAALPLLHEIREDPATDEGMRLSAEAAIRAVTADKL